jgi:transmembrane sensor
MSKAAIKPDMEATAEAAARWVARRDAGLSAEAQQEFAAWLAADPRHASAIDHFAKTWSVFDQPQRTGAAAAVLSEVSRRAMRRRGHRLQIAGASCAILLLGAMVWRSVDGGRSSAAELPRGVVLLQPELRTLPDGSVVEVRPGTGLTVSFDDAFRRVSLHGGQAHFQVAKNQGRPFIVEAGGVQVRAIGTAFAVQSTSAQLEVIVTEGHVSVDQPAGKTTPDVGGSAPPPRHLATLTAGERVVVDVSGESPAVPVVNTVRPAEISERLAWRIPRLEFSGTPLGEAVALMNRSTVGRKQLLNLTIVLDSASPGLADEPVSGLFRADNTEAFVHVLELSLGVKAERRGDNEIVLSRAR